MTSHPLNNNENNLQLQVLSPPFFFFTLFTPADDGRQCVLALELN